MTFLIQYFEMKTKEKVIRNELTEWFVMITFNQK